MQEENANVSKLREEEKALLEEYWGRINALRAVIDKEEAKAYAGFIGRYFTFDNSFGDGQIHPMYFNIIKLGELGEIFAYGFSYHTKHNCSNYYEIYDMYDVDGLIDSCKEITKEEYEVAKKEFLGKVNQIL